MKSRCGALVALGLLVAAADAGAMSKCLERDGRCMAVTVNGQTAVKLSKRTKTLLKGLQSEADREVRYELGEARYEAPLPIRGPLAVTAERSSDSGDWFGEGRTFETMVMALDQVDLRTSQRLSTVDNVSVGGGSPLVVENVLEGNRLPPGRYLLTITLSGKGNWDRMTLYVQVED
jgi:hypothetical protein